MASHQASATRSKWLLGCGIGCTVLVMIALGVTGGGLYYFSRLAGGVDQAIDTRSLLNERHGDPEDYVPPADGAVPPDRMEAFLEVREALQPLCPRFEDSFGNLDAMSEKEHVSGGEILGAFRSIWGTVPLISDFFQARNQALLEAGMGLGEYTYLYVLAYHSGTGADPEDRPGRRVRGSFVNYLEAQAEAVASPGGLETTGFREALTAEIAAMKADATRIPWEDGMPEVLAQSIEPYRQALDRFACRAADEMALSVTHRGGLTIRAD